MVKATNHIASMMAERYRVDLSKSAYEACASLMLDAERIVPHDMQGTAARLVPSLLRSHREPVSSLISVLFPIIYRELAKADEIPDFFKFLPFIDWDRCKTARHELVSAFLASSWAPGDLVLTAFRCRDTLKFLKRVAKSYGGSDYLYKIERDLGRLPAAYAKKPDGAFLKFAPIDP
jgi:hypothetical protein